MAEPVTPPPADAATRSRTPLWVKILLACSLALNLLIAGIVVGAMMRFGDRDHRAPRINYALPYVKALPGPDRRAVMQAVRREAREGGPSTREPRRALYAEMLTALRADPFDAAAVGRLLDRQASASARIQTRARTVWLDRVTAMSAAERRAYAERIEESLRRGPRHERP